MIAGYESIAVLYESDTIEVTRSLVLATDAKVIVKRLRRSAHRPRHRARLRYEYKVLQALKQANVSGIMQIYHFHW